MTAFKEALSAQLAEDHWAKALGVEPKVLRDVVRISDWSERGAAILKNRPIQVTQVVALAADFLIYLGIEVPAEWGQMVYQHATTRLFDDADETTIEAGAVTFTLDLLSFFLDREELPTEDFYMTFPAAPESSWNSSRHRGEYQRLRDIWEVDYIQEIMRLGRELFYFDLLAHVAGVHHVAMAVGQQLAEAGVSVDLPLLSGAAMVHDIGKFGCRTEEEIRRMPYLHYYYTEQWCEKQRLPGIGHIAMNHSTWDLELENLSVESLLLIYADFRVKAAQGPRGEHEVMQIYGLEDSFQVILDKLDNVDDAKHRRYQRVYHKLADFEAYMQSYGVDVSLGQRQAPNRRSPWRGVLNAEETPQIFKDLAFEHNTMMMNVLADPDYLRNMLEALRTSGRSVDIRANLTIFEEYITYMSRPQKELIFSYLLEMLTHNEGDIRRQAARLIGQLVAGFDERYSKWLPEGKERNIAGRRAMDLWQALLTRIFAPDHKMSVMDRRHQGYAFQNTLEALLYSLPVEDTPPFMEALVAEYRRPDTDQLSIFFLVDALSGVRFASLSAEGVEAVLGFAARILDEDLVEIRLAILSFYESIVSGHDLSESQEAGILAAIDATPMLWSGETYLRAQVRALIIGGEVDLLTFRPGELFLENLKASTTWQVKLVNLRRLADALIDRPEINRLHVALHLSNLLKVSEQIAVRHEAGRKLIEIAPLLSPEEINEVVVELYRGLEMDSFEFTKYIPEYLSRFAANLAPDEYDEYLDSMGNLLENGNDTVAQLAIDGLAHAVAGYRDYGKTSGESETALRARLSKLCGYLMKGLASYHESVRVESLQALGRIIFGNTHVALQSKAQIFDILYKRLLMLLIPQGKDSTEVFYGRCALFNDVYRFLSEYLFRFERLDLYENRKVAFFPGTFDPFTLGHKGIVQRIRDMDCDVFLSLDEFSWSKNTQPPEIRRHIMQMSIAPEENVMLFPPVFPVNLANNDDLTALEGLFAGKELYLVVGSDVLAGASAYREPSSADGVHRFNHIVVARPGDGFADDQERQKALQKITGKTVLLRIDETVEHCSSTTIRANIDGNRDISDLIDPMAQHYIYDTNLYLGESKLKPVLNPSDRQVQILSPAGLEGEVARFLECCHGEALAQYLGGDGEHVLVLVREQGQMMALMVVQLVSSSDLYQVIPDRTLVSQARAKGVGTFAVFSHLLTIGETDRQEVLAQIVFAHALMWATEENATLAIYQGQDEDERGRRSALLQRHGFLPVSAEAESHQWYAMVDMRMPLVLSDNVSTLIKEPFAGQADVQRTVFQAHCRLQASLTAFYPGQLVLSYDAQLVERKLAQLIAAENGVSGYQGVKRHLGPGMCVPYGHLLREGLVPNTVTRPLFVQRIYPSGMFQAKVAALPYYDTIPQQAKVLHSFRRPVLLVDEVFNRGHTFELLADELRKAKVPVQCVLTGLVTGDGLDLLRSYGLRVRSVHQVPTLRYWLVDSKGYPFIDGYVGADRPHTVMAGLEGAINPILPYAAPPLFRNADAAVLWHYSRVSLENAYDILRALEKAYQEEHQRNLTLHRMPEVLTRPMLPDAGEHLSYDLTRSPSEYLRQSLDHLAYLENMIPEEQRKEYCL